MPSMDLVFRFLGVDAGAGPEFDRMAGKAGLTGTAFKTLAKTGAVAAAGITIASIKMASDFQTQMTRLNTQANVSRKNVAAFSKGILDMASSVASTPNQLAPAAYHIASIGQGALTTAQELRVLKIATEGAKIGGADLTDVTNALDAAIVSHIRGVKNYSQAMGVLNSTVGAGDMTMQDLAEAFGPLGAVMKGYNVDIRQVGAALATFGDNNVRGAQAGTALRMSVQALAVPMKAGQAQLEAWGIKSGNLSKQLEHGGLTSALDTLMAKMRENGVTAKDQGTVLTEAFGKRAGIGLAVLMGELDRYHEKLKQTTQGANGFASSWKGYTKTFGYAWDSAKAAAESMLIELGTKLLPVATKVTNWIAQTAIPDISKLAGWLKTNVPVAIGVLVGAFNRVQPTVSRMATGVMSMLHQVGSTFRTVFSTAKDITRVALAVIAVFWQRFGRIILSNLKSTFENIVTVIRGAFKVVQGIFEVIDGVLTLRWSKIWSGLEDIFGGFVTAVGGIARQIGTTLKTAVLGTLEAIKTGWSLGWRLIERVFGAIGGAILAGLADLANGALAFMGTFVHAASSAFGWVPIVGGKLKTAARDFDNFKSNTVSSLRSLSSQMYGLGASTADNYTSGITIALASGTRRVRTAAANMVSAIDAGARHKIESHSPSQVAIRTAQTYGYGLIVGLKTKTQPLKNAAKLLMEGLTGGWRGLAASVKNALTTPVQNALAALQTALGHALTKAQDAVKKSQQHYKSLMSAQRSAISSLQGQLAGGSDLSNVFTQDAAGNPMMLNASNYLTAQAGPLKQFAADMKSAARMHLAPALLSQIAQMGAVQGDQVLRQFLTGGAPVAQANQAERLIQSYARQAASVVVRTPHEQEQMATARRAVHVAEQQLHEQRVTNRKLEHLAAKGIAGHSTFTINGKTVHLKDEDAKRIVQILRRYERQSGKRILAP